MTIFFQHSVTKTIITLLSLFTWTSNIYADPYFEGFNNIKGTEDYLSSVPEGWNVIGNINYFGLSKRYYKTSSPSLTYTSGGNSSDYLVTPLVSGKVTFWYYGTHKNTKGSLKIFECKEENGTLTVGDQIGNNIQTPNQTWTQYSIELTEGKRLAILMSRTAIDDFYAETLGNSSGNDNPPIFVEKKSLTALSFERVSDYEITANEDNKYSVSFNVKVQNSGNVTLKAEEISVSVTDRNGTVMSTATATDSLQVDSTVVIPITVTADAAQGGYYSFYAKENLSNTYVKNDAGNEVYANVHVTAYYATFAIYDADGLKLISGELIVYGTSNVAVTKTVTIKNDGTAPLKVTNITLPEGFATQETTFDVAANGEKTVCITMPISEPYGLKQGNVTIEHALGTFTFAVKGTTVDPNIYFENFESNALPESWIIGERWTITSQSGNHYVQQNNNTEATAIITQRLTVNEGEVMTFAAKRAYSTTASTLAVSYSANKTDWTEAGQFNLTSSFDTYTLNNIPAGDVYLKFEGQYLAIDDLIGFHESTNAPILTVYNNQNEALSDSTASHLGTITTDTLTTYIIKNTGTGTLYVQIKTEGDITANKQKVTLTAGQSDSIKISLPLEPFGQKEGLLIITGEEKEIKVLLTAFSRDPKLLFVDFQNQTWPKGWTTEEKWSITHESYSSTEYYAEHYDYTGKPSSVITQKLKVGEGQTMTFQAKRASEVNASKLAIYASTDRIQWTAVKDYTEQLSNEWTSLTLDHITPGEYFLRFEAANVDIDDIEGFEPIDNYHFVTVDAMLPDSAIINWEYVAKATVKNIWADSEEVTVKFFLNGEEKACNTYTLAYGESQNMSYSFTAHEVASDQKAWFEVSYNQQTVKSDEKTFNIVAESDEVNAKTISGIVVYDDDETWTIANVSIVLKAIDKDVIYQTVSDDKGQFSIKIYRSDLQYTLTATKEGLDEYTQPIVYVNDGNEYTIKMTDIQTNIDPQNSARPEDACKARYLKPQIIYDLQGRCVNNKAKGIIIINGKKINKK